MIFENIRCTATPGAVDERYAGRDEEKTPAALPEKA